MMITYLFHLLLENRAINKKNIKKTFEATEITPIMVYSLSFCQL